jgi:[glutamine synthetase] adenylyltransferase / [glutamine synthetase]-adenylyl-L-tyrosine phosphorylase
MSSLPLEEIDRQRIHRILSNTLDRELRAVIEASVLRELSKVQRPTRCIERLSTFVENARAPNTLLSQWERDPDLLASLLQYLDVDCPRVEWLLADTDCLDWIRQVDRPGVDPEFATDLLLSELRQLDEESQILSAMRRFRRREWLRALFAWQLQDPPLQAVQQQWSASMVALIRGAYEFAFRDKDKSLPGSIHLPRADGAARSTPSQIPSATPWPISILAVGSLGAMQSTFDGPIELMCICDAPQLEMMAREYRHVDLEHAVRRIERWVELLDALGDGSAPIAFPMQLDLPAFACRLSDAQSWLDAASVHGNALHRVGLLSARPIAGDLALGSALLRNASSFVFPKYSSRSEIASLASYLRRQERRSRSGGEPGGAVESPLELATRVSREVESLVHFLQLIHGCELPDVRVANTSDAIDRLQREGCLTGSEHALLSLTWSDATRGLLHAQMLSPSVPSGDGGSPLTEGSRGHAPWLARLRDASPKIQTMTSHLRSEAFADETPGADESDLILDPMPDPDWVHSVLTRYRFQDIPVALRELQDLAVEEVRVLSTQRCRYFLSVIAPSLLDRIGQTPAPDSTLKNLAATCRSIGAKGVLWELFSLHQPSMELYVRLCGASPYLVGILTSNPGMIDELVDSLMLGRLPSEKQLSVMLDELCRGAMETESIVHSFKNTMHLNVGVRDILGKESVSDTHRALSDVADVCLQQTIQQHYNALVKRYGIPSLGDGATCRFGVLALGKLGSREPNYHSDVTILFVAEAGGETRPIGPMRHHQAISNDFFFHQLAQRVAQGVNRVTRYGRLYELHNWNISGEPSSSLAWQISALQDTFCSGRAPAADRQLLCTARVVAGDSSFQQPLTHVIQQILHAMPWTHEDTRSMLSLRRQLEETATPENLKRGAGGTLDVEYIAQLLSLLQFKADANYTVSGTIESLEQLRRLGRLPADDALQLKDAYNFLRGVESGLRLMNTKARHDLPKDPAELARLAYGLQLPDPSHLVESCEHYRHLVRDCFSRIFPETANA